MGKCLIVSLKVIILCFWCTVASVILFYIFKLFCVCFVENKLITVVALACVSCDLLPIYIFTRKWLKLWVLQMICTTVLLINNIMWFFLKYFCDGCIQSHVALLFLYFVISDMLFPISEFFSDACGLYDFKKTFFVFITDVCFECMVNA